MPTDDGVVEIVVCLGSSCFARGNSENLAIINKHIQSRGLNASVRLTGRLCQDQCKLGPNLTIGGELYHGVTAARLRELLAAAGQSAGRRPWSSLIPSTPRARVPGLPQVHPRVPGKGDSRRGTAMRASCPSFASCAAIACWPAPATQSTCATICPAPRLYWQAGAKLSPRLLLRL